jgi:galactose mutarotase-like enzyme
MFKKVELRNEFLKLIMVPELGGKITEIWDAVHNYEWLWSDETRPLRRSAVGDNYAAYDISGMDECFPNIGVSLNPNFPQELLNDHGDLWSCAWEITNMNDSWSGKVSDPLGRYVFMRNISLIENTIVVSYKVQNIGAEPFYFMWSAHPLFSLRDEMEIIIEGSPSMIKEFGFGERMGPDGADGYLGHGNKYVWPYGSSPSGEKIDLSKIKVSPKITDKVILNTATFSEVQLRNLKNGRSCVLKFDHGDIPFLGICANLGAWPFEGKKQTWIALEPMFGDSDSLMECVSNGTAKYLDIGRSLEWTFSIKVA